jgi:hypothetical protein
MRLAALLSLAVIACGVPKPAPQQTDICGEFAGTETFEAACQQLGAAISAACDAGFDPAGCGAYLQFDGGGCVDAEYYCTADVQTCATNIQSLGCAEALAHLSCDFRCGVPE